MNVHVVDSLLFILPYINQVWGPHSVGLWCLMPLPTKFCLYCDGWGYHGRERMVVGFITIYAISAYHQ